jgi:hypothetical protein
MTGFWHPKSKRTEARKCVGVSRLPILEVVTFSLFAGAFSRLFLASQQCFSLTTNQLTVFSATCFQLSEQAESSILTDYIRSIVHNFDQGTKAEFKCACK